MLNIVIYLILLVSCILALLLLTGRTILQFSIAFWSLVLLDTLSIASAYTFFSSEFSFNANLAGALGFTLLFSLFNLCTLNLMFRMDYALEEFCQHGKKQSLTEEVSDFFLDLSWILVATAFLLMVTFIAYSFQVFVLFLLAQLLPLVGLTIATTACCLVIAGALGLVGLTIKKHSTLVLNNLSSTDGWIKHTETQSRVISFFTDNKSALRDPLCLSLGVASYLRESNLFFGLLFIVFFRYDGGLSFCVASTLFLVFSGLSLLPCVRTHLRKVYGLDIIHKLGWNIEETIAKGFIKKGGPKAVAVVVGVVIATEGLVSGRRIVEQFANNIIADMSNTTSEVAPRRSIFSGKPIK